MRYQYVVILKKTTERATDVLSILLCVFSAMSFLFNAKRPGSDIHPYAPSLSVFLALILLNAVFFNIFLTRRNHKNGRGVRYRYWLLLAALGWIGITPVPWVGAFFLLLAFLEYQTKRPLEIGFATDRIVMNTLLKRRFDWSMLNNVVLKDGL